MVRTIKNRKTAMITITYARDPVRSAREAAAVAELPTSAVSGSTFSPPGSSLRDGACAVARQPGSQSA